MRLPGAERAVIETSKLRDYLLSRSHPIGRFKAAFFAGLGYTDAAWEGLQSDLRNLALSHDAEAGQESHYGRKYEVRGTLEGPSGRSAEVVTVWIVPAGDDVPHFVTAFPGEKP